MTGEETIQSSPGGEVINGGRLSSGEEEGLCEKEGSPALGTAPAFLMLGREIQGITQNQSLGRGQSCSKKEGERIGEGGEGAGGKKNLYPARHLTEVAGEREERPARPYFFVKENCHEGGGFRGGDGSAIARAER